MNSLTLAYAAKKECFGVDKKCSVDHNVEPFFYFLPPSFFPLSLLFTLATTVIFHSGKIRAGALGELILYMCSWVSSIWPQKTEQNHRKSEESMNYLIKCPSSVSQRLRFYANLRFLTCDPYCLFLFFTIWIRCVVTCSGGMISTPKKIGLHWHSLP